MSSEKQREKDLNLNAMVGNLLAPDQPEPEIAEELLWSYALNALELPQREQVLRLVARSEKARERLERIEQSIVVQEIPVVERVLQHVIRILKEMGRDLPSVTAVIGRMEGGLVSVLDQLSGRPQTLAPQGLMLGDKEPEPGEGEGVRARIDVGEVDGLRASVVFVSREQVDIHVITPPESQSQMIKLFLLEPDGHGGERKRQVDVSRVEAGTDDRGETCGVLLFSSCPKGILEIAMPDGRELTICCV